MKWRPTTAFLTGACLVLACVVATYFLQRFAQLAVGSPRPPTVNATNQPAIQRPPHKLPPTIARKAPPKAATQVAANERTAGTDTASTTRTQTVAAAGVAPALRAGDAMGSRAQQTAFGGVHGSAGSAITGRVVLVGTPPPETEIKMGDADPQCAKMHLAPVKTRRYTVGSNGELADVFVYVKGGLAGKKFEAPKQPVILDQQGCIYTPYVMGIQVGQTLEIVNSDATAHNVHIMPEKNPDKNIGQPVKGMRSKHHFVQEEVMVKFKCDIHPWMFAYVGVLSHPFFAVTDESGSFKISGIPAGKYTIEAWHVKAGTITDTVEVATNRVEQLIFQFEIK